MQIDYAPHAGQAKSGTRHALFARGRGNPIVGFENSLAMFPGNVFAFVEHLEPPEMALRPEADIDPAFPIGIFHRVLDQVEQQDVNPLPIRAEFRGEVRFVMERFVSNLADRHLRLTDFLEELKR